MAQVRRPRAQTVQDVLCPMVEMQPHRLTHTTTDTIRVAFDQLESHPFTIAHSFTWSVYVNDIVCAYDAA